MFRAHELIENLNKDSKEYFDCISSIKFDIGDIKSAAEMADVSTKEFFRIPAKLCLFQVTQESDIHFFLAKETQGGAIWKRFGRQANDGNRWAQEDIELYIEYDTNAASIVKTSTGEALFSENDCDSKAVFEKKFYSLPGSSQWSLIKLFDMASAVEVFSCSNVTTISHDAPKFINMKRKKKKKTPIFSYVTLHITGETTKKDTKNKSGTHASPRLHLRRGHIRRLSNDRRIWVTSCLVGDRVRGFVSKDYSVHMGEKQGTING
ncbi:MAG: hypothetical protein WD266_03445 [Balneolales bacterium]